jgi:hypothetical protein
MDASNTEDAGKGEAAVRSENPWAGRLGDRRFVGFIVVLFIVGKPVPSAHAFHTGVQVVVIA